MRNIDLSKSFTELFVDIVGWTNDIYRRYCLVMDDCDKVVAVFLRHNDTLYAISSWSAPLEEEDFDLVIFSELKERIYEMNGSIAVPYRINNTTDLREFFHAKSFHVSSLVLLSIRESLDFQSDGTIPETCASIVSKNYEMNMYSGFNSYHTCHGANMNKPLSQYKYRFGIELEVEFPNSGKRAEFTGIETNLFHCESDGSLSNSGGCEIITIPLLPNDAKNPKFWEKMTTTLNDLGATSWKRTSTGLHVHVSKEIFGDTEGKQSDGLGKALYLYYSFLEFSELNIAVFGRRNAYNNNASGQTEESKAVRILGKDCLKQKAVADKVKKSIVDKTRSDRYYEVNIRNLDSLGTVEFRKGKGSICADRIAGVVEWVELICLYAVATRIQNISYEGFIAYVKKKARKNSMILRKLSDEE